MENAPDIVDELERINKMTPDEAYRHSVETTGRANGITDEMHAAAITPAPKPAPTATQPTQPAVPSPEPVAPVAAPGQPPKTVVGADGKGRTTFGGYVRVVDQKTGGVTWEDTNGNPVEAPKSQQMMDKLNQGLRPKGDLSWDDALKQQSFESIGKAQQYARNAIEANRLAIENSRKRKAKQNAKVADEMGSAFANLQGNLEDVSKHIADGGSIEDSDAYKSKDGNYYVRGIVAVDRLGEFNKEMAGLGGKDSMERIVVSQQVSKTTGKPIGEPTFAALYRKNGIDGQGDGVYAKKLNLAQAVNYARKSQVDLGRMSDQEAKEYAVWAFGGKNPLNWDVKKPDAIDPKMAIESGKLGVEQDRQRLEWAKFNAMQNNGPAWNKDQHEAMSKMLDSLMYTTDAVTGDRTPREMSPDEQKQADFLRGQIMRGFGYTPVPDQSQQPQYTDEDRAAAIAKLRERGVNFDASNGSDQGSQYGLRNDGKTYKGTGWLGELKLPNGGVATEYTVGVNINGKEMDIPSLVPTLSKAEQDQMVNDIIPNNKPVPDAILKKAVEFAKLRIQNGQSVFANDGKPPAGATKPQDGETKPPAGETQALKKGTVPKRTSADVRREMEERGKTAEKTPVPKPDGFYEGIDKGDIEELKRLYPDATDEDIAAGKFDRQLRNIGRDNKSGVTTKAFGEYDALVQKHKESLAADNERKEQEWRSKQLREFHNESSKRQKEITDEVKRRGLEAGWPKWKIEEETKKAISDETDRLQKKYKLKRKPFTGELY